MANLKEKFGLKNNIEQFSNFESAQRWASNCIKLHTVMLGENNKYWVCCFSDAQKLCKIGYEIAE